MENLNEHINRMKDLFNAQHGIIKPLISEDDKTPVQSQVTQVGVAKDNKDVLFDSEYLEDFPLNNTKQNAIKTKNPNFDVQLAEVKKHPAYKLFVDKIKDYQSMMEIFFFYLNQASRLQFLNQTLDFVRSFTNKRKLEKRVGADPNYTGEENLVPWEVELVKGDITTSKEDVETQAAPNQIDIEIPLQIAGKNVYVDNSNEPDVTLIQAVDKWVADTVNEINGYKTQDPTIRAELISIDIVSSCSRLRNTEGYTNKTWNELSKDRAQRVYELITSKLTEIGVTLNPNVQKVLRGGYNKDGSSGPDPAKNFTFDTGEVTNNMSYSTNGANQLYGPDSKRQVFTYGKLLQTQAESHQYKFCIVLAKIKLISTAPGQVQIKPKIIKSQGYSLELKPEKKSNYSGKLKSWGGYKGGGKDTFVARAIPSVKAAIESCPAYN